MTRPGRGWVVKTIENLWTETGEYTDETGNTLSGREEIQKAYAEFFELNPKVKISVTIDSLRMLSDDSAIEERHTMAAPVAAGTTGASRYTAFHVKVDGKWKMAAVSNTEIQAPVAYHNLSDLDWLIGTWIAEEHGVKLESSCRWIANNTFVERRYKATHLDGSSSEGLQIIGWNPYAEHIQSWDFSSDGGNAAGQLAGIRRHPSLRAGRSDAGLRQVDRRSRGQALRDHRI